MQKYVKNFCEIKFYLIELEYNSTLGENGNDI